MLKKPSRYIENLVSCCLPPQVRQSIFLSNALGAEGPDTYMDNVLSVSIQQSLENRQGVR
ncbi:MAG: hypothetical protein AB8U44_02105 [Aaplasma endosymbiont of Hyalomma asiaticum]